MAAWVSLVSESGHTKFLIIVFIYRVWSSLVYTESTVAGLRRHAYSIYAAIKSNGSIEA